MGPRSVFAKSWIRSDFDRSLGRLVTVPRSIRPGGVGEVGWSPR